MLIRYIYFLFCFFCFEKISFAQNRLNFTAHKYVSNLDTKVTHATGSVEVLMGNRTLKADEIFFYGLEGKLKAIGNVHFVQGDLTIEARQIEMDMDTGLGDFYDFVLRMGTSVYVEGQYLNRYGTGLYRVSNGKISRCMDCPQSWSVFGSEINIEIEKYAQIHSGLIQIKDAPTIYVPYFFVPIKTKRESGFLVPQYSQTSDLGFSMKLPFFWAINKSSDSTLEYHLMSKGGNRLNTEYRYRYSNKTYLDSKFSVVRNYSVPQVADNRFGYSLEERAQLNSEWVQRFRGEGASDIDYSRHFATDFNSAQLPTLMNELSVSKYAYNSSFLGLAQVHQDNLPRKQTPLLLTENYGRIQKAPAFNYTIPSYTLMGPLRIENESGVDNYFRQRNLRDPKTDWIRSGTRATEIVRWSAPTNIHDLFLWEPSVETRADVYRFKGYSQDFSAYRVRNYFDQRLSTQFARVYAYNGLELKSVKHSLEPQVRWSYSPPDKKTDHPFFQDKSGPKFDLFDPNSESAVVNLASQSLNEEQRLKYHHLVTYGFKTKFTGRYNRETSTYFDFFGAGIQRDYDLVNKSLSRLRLNAFSAYGPARLETVLAIDTNTMDIDSMNSAAYSTNPFELKLTQSVGGAASRGNQTETYSMTSILRGLGSWDIASGAEFDSRRNLWVRESYDAAFNSLSKCWKFEIGFEKLANQKGFDFNPRLKILFTEAETVKTGAG